MLLHNRISWFKQYNVNSPADAQLQAQTHVEASYADSTHVEVAEVTLVRWMNSNTPSPCFKKIDR